MRIEIIGAGVESPIIHHNGEKFVVAKKGQEYQLRVHNNSGRRRLAVLSIDGQNIVTGEKATKDGDGWVLNPWQTCIIRGWHRTNEEAAAFKFSELGASYSSQTGKGTDNTGVIGCAVFEEKYRPSWGETPRSGSCGSWSRSWPQEPKQQDTATAYGRKVDQRTQTVSFDRGELLEVISIRYASRKVLQSWGVPLKQKEPTPAPSAFPEDAVSCPAPAGWQG